MRFLFASDLHLDFLDPTVREGFYRDLSWKMRSDTILLCAGDTTIARDLVEHHRRLAECCSGDFCFVLGNHDRWGSSFDQTEHVLRDLPRNAHFMDIVENVVVNDVAIFGDSSWYDGRNGHQGQPRLLMNDWWRISDFLGKDPRTTGAIRADRCERRLRSKIVSSIARGVRRMIVLMHVPPFEEACVYKNRPTEHSFLPWYSCRVMGDMLDELAGENPDVMFEVLCGHTHGGRVYRRWVNLRVTVAAAEYGSPTAVDWHPELW